MAIEFVVDPPLTDELRARIVALWVEVTNDGGAVGFVAPVSAGQVRPVAEAAFAAVADGVDRLIVGVDGGELVALLFLVDNRFPLKEHWRVLKRVMVAPGSQGRGYGAAMTMRLAEDGAAVGCDIAILQASDMDKPIYERLGFRTVVEYLGYVDPASLPAATPEPAAPSSGTPGKS